VLLLGRRKFPAIEGRGGKGLTHWRCLYFLRSHLVTQGEGGKILVWRLLQKGRKGKEGKKLPLALGNL